MKDRKHGLGSFPIIRMRRNRLKNFSRKLIKENHLNVNDLILPVFITAGKNEIQKISSMPGVFRYSPDRLLKHLDQRVNLIYRPLRFFRILTGA